MSTVKIKSRVLIPLAIAVIGLLGAFVTGTYRVLEMNLDDEVDRYLSSVKKYLKAQHQRDLDELGAAVVNIAQSREVQAAWTDKEQDRLSSMLQPYLTELKFNHDISHLYLYDSLGNLIHCMDGCPAGDQHQDGFTLSRARVTGRFSYGMELCEHGTFSMRVVMPWLVDDRLAGYIEIGKELQSLTRDIPSVLGVDVAALVEKQYLNRAAWDRAFARPDSGAGWDALAHYVTVEKSLDRVPAEVDEWLSQPASDHLDLKRKLTFDDRTYTAAFLPLIDAQARDVGEIVLFYDTTARTERARRLFAVVAAACLLVGIALFVSFYKMLGGLEDELVTSRHLLIEESQARLEIEKRHVRELAAHVVNLEMNRSREQRPRSEIDQPPRSENPA